ncbi:unnamed protein product [Hermetia illucens]|uniref:Cytochrome b5-related protein n=1 Tax=Hermetia illucens TaxID=343691 RepID=A0A7R8YV33_HERIL|nr:cytochrome b5-related protein-like [Hermetia illucens]CAD7085894.1 unnamed protein product [Hermetia illucens]
MTWKNSQISNKFPTYRNSAFITTHSWLEGKRKDDNAEGLWRVHDSIYDLSDFINKHPGGPDWLKLTKGTDITELFEAHHLTSTPERILEKYKVRDAKEPRNITLSLKEDGFYRTLKSRVIEKLKTIDCKKYSARSDLIHSSILALSYIFSMASAFYESKILGIIAGLFITWTVIIAHNYFHRKDNWRMYTFNLSLMNYKDWRVSHVLSHHMFPNSYHDLELSAYEPIFCWVPNPFIKNFTQRYISWIYFPFVYTVITILEYIKRTVYSIAKGVNLIEPNDALSLTVPLAMYVVNSSAPLKVLQLWLIILLSASFTFALIGLHAAHHLPENLHEGDAMRDNRDWGLYQMDTIIDRRDLKGSQFLVLTHFGDHTLHHLFPTLDHGILPHLYPILYQTIEDFEGQLRECSWLHHIIGQFKQLARITPNPLPPKN